MAKKIFECPYCGNTKDFYRKGRVSGSYVCYYDFDGNSADNTHIHDGIRYNEQQSCYCGECERKLPTKLENQLNN